MIAIMENLCSRDSSSNHSHVTLGQFSTLQSYVVRFGIEIPIIFGLLGNEDCIHISLILLGPYFDHHCYHIWSP